MDETFRASISPALTVSDAAAAVEFYERALGAVETKRHVTPTGLVVAEMAIDQASFLVVDEAAENFNLSPATLNGTSVRISLIVPDPDAVAERAVAAGARVLFPVADQPYGFRQGRIVDPFGHHWLIGKPLKSE